MGTIDAKKFAVENEGSVDGIAIFIPYSLDGTRLIQAFFIYIYLFRSIVLSVYFSVMIFFKNNLQRYLQLCFIENCNGIISDTMDTFLKY